MSPRRIKTYKPQTARGGTRSSTCGASTARASGSRLSRGRSEGDWVEIARTELRVEQPAPSDGRRAVFTIAQNEPNFLLLWVRHYRRHFDASDIYVLDHDSTDRSISAVHELCNVLTVHHELTFDHLWLKSTVENFFSFLLSSYPAVLFTDVDEFVVTDPERYPDLGTYIENLRATRGVLHRLQRSALLGRAATGLHRARTQAAEVLAPFAWLVLETSAWQDSAFVERGSASGVQRSRGSAGPGHYD